MTAAVNALVAEQRPATPKRRRQLTRGKSRPGERATSSTGGRFEREKLAVAGDRFVAVPGLIEKPGELQQFVPIVRVAIHPCRQRGDGVGETSGPIELEHGIVERLPR